MKDDAQYDSFLRSWVLRILDCPAGRSAFICKGSFRDADVADFLGYEEPEAPSEEAWGELRKRFFSDLRAERNRNGCVGVPEPIRSNLMAFRKRFALSGLHERVLLFAILRNEEEMVCDAVNVISSRRKNQLLGAICRCCGSSQEKVRAVLSEGSPLLSSGVLKVTRRGLGHPNVEVASDRLVRSFFSQDFKVDEALLEVALELPPPTLHLKDYPHLTAKCRRLREYLARVLREKRSGVNVLLYGPPGTGKSELARVLAKAVRVRALEVSAVDEDRLPVRAKDRLENLHSAQRLLPGMRVLLVFDECEDVFRGDSHLSRGAANESKAWMNRFLETNPVPTIWISNVVWAIDDAFLRRFDSVIEMGPLPRARRIPVYRKICGEEASTKLIRQLAEVEEVTPAIVARAAEVARRTCSGKSGFDQEVRDLVSETIKAQGHPSLKLRKNGDSDSVPFSTRWINSDPGLEDIRRNLTGRNVGCRMCLYGPPGTGKTAFGRWLADKLGKPLHVKRASDVLSPFLGMTEIQLARAFEEAESDMAILMIDEIDSLLRNRRDGVRSWEITQVNEFLTQMEAFSGLLICSTNDWDALDPACLRRFDLKAKLQFLRGDQVERLCDVFLNHLGLGRPGIGFRRTLRSLTNVTPGDFAVVARRHQFQPFLHCDSFIGALCAECELKSGSENRRLGFLASGD